MTKYHVNPETGKVGECTAKKGNCKFKITIEGEEKEVKLKHFANIERAQQYADLVNLGELKEPIKGELLKHRTAMEVYTRKNLFALFDRKDHAYQQSMDVLEKQYIYHLKNDKDKLTKEEFFKMKVEKNTNLSNLVKKRTKLLEEIRSIHSDRLQVVDFCHSLADISEDYSFSVASSSAYFVFQDEYIEDVQKYLNNNGFTYMTRPDFDFKTDGNAIVRFSNHFPKDYYANKCENVNEVWEHTDASVLVFYKKQTCNKMPNKIAKETENFVKFLWK